MSNDCKCDERAIWLDAIGYAGGTILAIAPWQQLWKTVRRGSAQDISLKAFALITVGLSMSIFFTAYTLILPILIPEIIEMTGWLILIILKICWFRDKKKNNDNSPSEVDIESLGMETRTNLGEENSETTIDDFITQSFAFTDLELETKL